MNSFFFSHLGFDNTCFLRFHARMKTKKARIDYELYLELVKLRDKIGVPVTESLRRAIREYVAKQKEQDANPESL